MKFTFATVALVAPLLVAAADSSASSTVTSATSTIAATASKSTATSSSSSSALIPSTISSSCKSFLNALNDDSTLSSCVNPLLILTSAAASSSSEDTSLSASLAKLCASDGCSSTTLRSKLTQFYGNCSAELNGPEGTYDETVRGIYDLLYVVHPLKEVVCTVDANSDEYCVTALSSNVTTSAVNSTISSNVTDSLVNAIVIPSQGYEAVLADSPEHLAAQYLSVTYDTGDSTPILAKRASSSNSSSNSTSSVDDSTITYPNSTTYRTTNLPYLFIQPNSSSSIICSSCAKSIFTAYATWEINTPYALGLAASPILGGQAALWEGAEGTCGSVWTGKIQTAALGQAAAESDSSSGSSGLLSGGTRVGGLMGGWSTIVGLAVVGAGMAFVV